ncbi:MAG: hypothetical protein Q9227_008824 [Pyrenula ochraceoflavens]
MAAEGGPYAYITQAFNLSRVFLYKWTVNFRFLTEETFLSPALAYTLLLTHVSILLIFFQTRWIAPSRSKDVFSFARSWIGSLDWDMEKRVAARLSPKYITDVMLSCMAIGMLCARSLHYQFFVYIAWGTPYLLWRGGVPFPLIYVIWAAQEWAWLTFPSIDASSMIVIGVLIVQLAAIWFGTGRAKGEVAYDEETDKNDAVQKIQKQREEAIKAAEDKAHHHHRHEKSQAEAAAPT